MALDLRQIYLGVKQAGQIILMKAGLYNPALRGRHGLVGAVDKQGMKRQFQIDFLKKMGLLPHHLLLDIGCGTLRGGIPIISYLNRGCYFGLEARSFVLEEARRELEENGLQHKEPKLILVGDAEKELAGIKFDFIWAFSVIIHMTDDIFKETMRLVANHLKDDGAFYFNANVGNNKKVGAWQGFPVVSRPLSFYQAAARAGNLDLQIVDILKNLGHTSGVDQQDQQPMLRVFRPAAGT